jgi:hypothetical protein
MGVAARTERGGTPLLAATQVARRQAADSATSRDVLGG